MRQKGILSLLLLGVTVLFLQSAPAFAQATRTWVSGVGDDANPCSRTAPCKTFAGAISKTAASGEINVLDPGGFGGVTITKSITIDGSGGSIAGILVSGTNGIIVNAGASDRIVLRNLDINGINTGLNGINILAANFVTIENTFIQNFTQACIKAQVAASVTVVVKRSHLYACQGGGLTSSAGSSGNRISILESTVNRGAFAIQVGANSNVGIWNTSLVNNNGAGVQSTGSTAQVSIDQSIISNGGIGVQASNSSIIRLSNTSITNNTGTGLLADTGGQILTWSNNWVAGNSPDGSRTGTILPQ